MSIIAGCFSKNKKALSENRNIIERIVRSNLDENISMFKGEEVFFIKNDLGAFSAPGWYEKKKTVAMCAGEPLIYSDNLQYSGNRRDDLQLISQDFAAEASGCLENVNGMFCAAHYDGNGCLSLVSDKLGLRPLYYYDDGDVVIFASQLKIIEEIPWVNKEIDIVGIGELASFEFELCDRTPYQHIKIMHGGEIKKFNFNEPPVTLQYWDWNDIQPIDMDEDGLLEKLYEKFDLAVRVRLGQEKTVFSFLSGGMDSRCVVAALKNNGAAVHTFNCSPVNSEDTVFSKSISEQINTFHTYIPWEVGQESKYSTDYYGMIFSEILNHGIEHSEFKEGVWPEHPSVAWAGDGGSVGLGHGYMKEEIISLLREGNIEAGLRAYVEKRRLAQRFFDPESFDKIKEGVLLDVMTEFSRFSKHEPVRAFHLFLMLTAQRRHLHRPLFESIDIYKKEFQVPFFDSSFLEVILGSPVDGFLRHSFYNKWIKKFPFQISSIPWQSYVGHEKCPLPIPSKLSRQWDEVTLKSTNKANRRRNIKRFFPLLLAKNFPSHLLNRNWIRVCCALYLLGIKDTGWILHQSKYYFDYWGKYAMQKKVDCAADIRKS